MVGEQEQEQKMERSTDHRILNYTSQLTHTSPLQKVWESDYG